jgi:hypothetical protein
LGGCGFGTVAYLAASTSQNGIMNKRAKTRKILNITYFNGQDIYFIDQNKALKTIRTIGVVGR